MLFTSSSKIAVLSLIMLILQGCQTVDNPIELKQVEPIKSTPKLTPIEIIHQSPNLYILTKPVVAPDTLLAFKAANELVKNKSWKLATKQLLKLTITAPTLSGPWLLLGDVAVGQKDTYHAIAHYRQAIYVNKHNYLARNRLAVLLREAGKFDEARNQYNLALKTWPGYVNANRNLGVLLDLYIGEIDKALKFYQTAFALDALNKTPEDRKLKGWIADLSRRITRIKKEKERKSAINKLKDQPNTSEKNTTINVNSKASS